MELLKNYLQDKVNNGIDSLFKSREKEILDCLMESIKKISDEPQIIDGIFIIDWNEIQVIDRNDLVIYSYKGVPVMEYDKPIHVVENEGTSIKMSIKMGNCRILNK